MNDSIKERINKLAALRVSLQRDKGLDTVIERAYAFNPWFTPDFCRAALDAIMDNMLDAGKLEQWLSPYNLGEDIDPKTVGIIMAGNLPLVGFHDFLCVYMTGHRAMIKLSGKDDVLFPYVYEKLAQIDPALKANASIVERMEGFDAVIATGSNNSNRYFEYYFRKYPKILRHNRSSVAVLSGHETGEELRRLADDIFMYFGFGCRNVSKLYVPEGYDLTQLFPHFDAYKWMHAHTKYMNNYDYNRTLLLMNRTPHLANEIIMLQESENISSPVSVLYHETYSHTGSLKNILDDKSSEIQCIVVNPAIASEMGLDNFVKFGNTQKPRLGDYADKMDTIDFLSSICQKSIL